MASGSRALALFGLSLVGIAIGAYSFVLDQDDVTITHMLAIPIASTLIMIGGTVVLRKRLWVSTFNRQAVFMLLSMMGVMLLHRLSVFVGLEFFQIEPDVAQVFATDCFVLAAALFVGSVVLLRWIAWIAILSVVAGTACIVYPEHALQLFGVGTSSEMVLAAVLAYIHRAGT